MGPRGRRTGRRGGNQLKTQQMIDFTYAEKRSILRNCELPKVDRVSTLLLKGVLTRIDDHDSGNGCYASQETLAREAGNVSVRQFRRAVNALLGLSVIACQRRRRSDGRSGNVYVVVWSELALLCRGHNRSRGRASNETSEAADQPDMRRDQTDMVSDQPDMGVLYQPDTHVRQKYSGGSSLKSDPVPAREPVPPDLQNDEELSDLWSQTVLAKPAGKLKRGIFHPLQTKHVKEPMQLVNWFASQLSADRPATGNSLAELVLVLATALYVTDPRNRSENIPARFAGIVGKNSWGLSVAYIPAARRALDAMRADGTWDRIFQDVEAIR